MHGRSCSVFRTFWYGSDFLLWCHSGSYGRKSKCLVISTGTSRMSVRGRALYVRIVYCRVIFVRSSSLLYLMISLSPVSLHILMQKVGSGSDLENYESESDKIMQIQIRNIAVYIHNTFRIMARQLKFILALFCGWLQRREMVSTRSLR
jgi:hypothetical protein